MSLFIQTSAALAFVLLLIVGMAFVYKKKQPGIHGLFQLVAYHSFGPRRGVAALRVGHEVLVLGVTNTDFKLLRVLDADKIGVRQEESSVSESVLRLRKIKEDLNG
jgi:flagellar biogenesis protein FliO